MGSARIAGQHSVAPFQHGRQFGQFHLSAEVKGMIAQRLAEGGAVRGLRSTSEGNKDHVQTLGNQVGSADEALDRPLSERVLNSWKHTHYQTTGRYGSGPSR